MTFDSLVKGQVALFCWREASQHGGDICMTAVMCCLRNRVKAGWGTWLEVISRDSKTSYRLEQPLQNQFPDDREPSWRRFFAKVDAIYEGNFEDITAGTQDIMWQPVGTRNHGLYWADLGAITNPWFSEKIVGDKENHKKVCTVAPLYIYS
jgi:hypothetical protein